MPREFNVPAFYRSPIISIVKKARRVMDPRKRDLVPSVLDFGPIRFKIARHFGFCYGVENAIEIAYRALEENPEKRIFLLSEMIHNPHVNGDLRRRGMQFLCDTEGNQLIPFDVLTPDDIVIVPAFGTTLEIQDALDRRGINPQIRGHRAVVDELRVREQPGPAGERPVTDSDVRAEQPQKDECREVGKDNLLGER